LQDARESRTHGDAQPNPKNMTPLTAEQQRFISSVLNLRPRVAVFDCDGTLWPDDAGEQFLYWELEHKLLAPKVEQWIVSRYRDYKGGLVDETLMCGEMVTIHEGISCEMLEAAAREFFDEKLAGRIFPEMRELTLRLRDSGCQLWAVSSTNDWVISTAMRYFGIPADHVLAACVYRENGCASGRLRQVPSGPDKPKAILAAGIGQVDAAFGNSVFDAEMLEMARHAFAINPNPNLEALARERGWTIYKPMEQRLAAAEAGAISPGGGPRL
jgi:phosphoserine phosphatase